MTALGRCGLTEGRLSESLTSVLRPNQSPYLHWYKKKIFPMHEKVEVHELGVHPVPLSMMDYT